MDYCFNNNNATKDEFKTKYKVFYKFLIDNIDELVLNNINVKISDNSPEHHFIVNIKGKNAASYRFTYGKRIFNGTKQVQESDVIDSLSAMVSEYEDSIASTNDTNLKYLYYIYPYKSTFAKSLRLAKYNNFYKSVFDTEIYQYLINLKGYLRKFTHEYDVTLIINTKLFFTITIFLDKEKSLKTSNYFSIKFISDTKDDKNKTLDKIIVTSRVNGVTHSYTHDGDTNESEMVGIFKSSIRSAISNSGNMTPKHEFNNSENGIVDNTQVIINGDYGHIINPPESLKGKLYNFLSYKDNNYKFYGDYKSVAITVDLLISKKLLGTRIIVKKSNVVPSSHSKYVVISISTENNKPIFTIMDEDTFVKHYSNVPYNRIKTDNLIKVTKDQIGIA